MPQSLSSLFQLRAQLLFVQDSTNGHGQLSEMLPFNVVESAISSELRDGFTPHGGGHEKQGNLLYRLMEELQGPRPFPTRAGVLGNHDIVRLGMEPFRTLCQVQDKISADGESRFVELFHAPVYYIGITMNEKDAKGTPPVRGRASRAERAPSRLEFVLCQV